MICKECGASIEQNNMICPNCGNKQSLSDGNGFWDLTCNQSDSNEQEIKKEIVEHVVEKKVKVYSKTPFIISGIVIVICIISSIVQARSKESIIREIMKEYTEQLNTQQQLFLEQIDELMKEKSALELELMIYREKQLDTPNGDIFPSVNPIDGEATEQGQNSAMHNMNEDVSGPDIGSPPEGGPIDNPRR